jgi:hypothetical protein
MHMRSLKVEKNSATSTMIDHVREEIAQLLDVVIIESGATEGSDRYYYATQLLIKKEYTK